MHTMLAPTAFPSSPLPVTPPASFPQSPGFCVNFYVSLWLLGERAVPYLLRALSSAEFLHEYSNIIKNILSLK